MSELKQKVLSRGRIYNSFLDTIGSTPLVRLPKLTKEKALKADVLAKLEFFNPLASVKDRAALYMVEEGERLGVLTPGKSVLIEPTSGNTGIGLAFVAASKGYRMILVMPESMSVERRKLPALMGAEVVLTPAKDGMKGAIDKAEALVDEIDGGISLGQFYNPANPKAHRETTALEIWDDTKGDIDIFISAVGTGGTLSGVGSVLKDKKPDLKVMAVEPSASHVLSGGNPAPHQIQGIGAGFIPANLDMSLIDEIIQIEDNAAFDMARYVARLEGLPIGISSGASLTAAIEVAQRSENKGKTIVTIVSSFAERYLSTALFDGIGE